VKSDVEEIMEELAEDADITVDPEHSHSQNILPAMPTSTTPTDVPVVHEPSPPAGTGDKEGMSAQNDEQTEAVVTTSETTPGSDTGDTPPEEVAATSPPPAEESKIATSSASSTSGDRKGVAKDRLTAGDSDFKYATLSRVRKFKVDNQVMQSTTKKIVDVNSNRTLRDNKKYQQMR